ncbi:MAG: hypothetical protein ACPGUD_06275 [Parashewanella sp.]
MNIKYASQVATLVLLYLAKTPFSLADEMPINIEPSGLNDLVIKLPTIGIFKNCNADENANATVFIRDTLVGNELTIPVDDGEPFRWSVDVNDLDNPGERTTRCKQQFNQNYVYARNNIIGPTPTYGTRQYDVYFKHNSTDNPATFVSAIQAGDEYIEVEFRGGNNQQPLGIFIEGGINFSGLNLSQLSDNEHLELEFINSGVHNARDQSLESFSTYNQDGTPTNTPSPNMVINEGAFYINATVSSSSDTKVGLQPSFLQTKEVFTSRKPNSGWYKVIPVACSATPRVCRPLSHTVNNDAPSFGGINTDSLAVMRLMTNGPTYAKTRDNKTYKQIIPLIVRNLDSDGRLRLYNWITNGNFQLGTLTPFDFRNTPNSDRQIGENRVRWHQLDAEGIDRFYTGRIGWHAADGSYAFLNKDDPNAPSPAYWEFIMLEQYTN